MTRTINAGTEIYVRRPGTIGWVPHTTTTPITIPADAGRLPTNAGKWCGHLHWFDFTHLGHGIRVRIDVVASTTSDRAEPHRCRRCAGRGHIAAYKHVQGGVCFGCGGTGTRGAAAAALLSA